jgi:Domain of unknown function (DUF4177)
VPGVESRRWDVSADAVPRTMWDYKTVVLTHGFMGYHKGELDRPKFELSLDELGREGYELTWVFMDQKLHVEKDGHVLIFKRAVVA